MSAAAQQVSDQIENEDTGIAAQLKPMLSNLEDLWTLKTAAADRWTEATDAAAKKVGLDKQVVRGYVNAKMRDKLREFERRSGQISLLMEEYHPRDDEEYSED